MSELTEKDYDAIAARLTDPDRPATRPAEVRTGADAAAEGREFLLREYGSMGVVDAIVRGRPNVGSAKSGPSPTVRGRIPKVEHAAFMKLVEATGQSESALVREAVHQLLERNRDKVS